MGPALLSATVASNGAGGGRDPVVRLTARSPLLPSYTSPSLLVPFVSSDAQNPAVILLSPIVPQPVNSFHDGMQLSSLADGFPAQRPSTCTRVKLLKFAIDLLDCGKLRIFEYVRLTLIPEVLSSSLLACRQRSWRVQRRQHRSSWLSNPSRRTTNCDPTPRCR